MKRLITLFVLATSLSAFAANPVRDSKTHFVKDAIQPFIDSGELPGAVAILYKDGVQETCCAGYADVEAQRPIRTDNVFMQCSQTKGFCGVTVAKLVEQGKLSLDDPVSKYLPEFAELWIMSEKNDTARVLRRAKNVLTVKQVLNHTGGFPFEICTKSDSYRGGGWTRGANLRQTAMIAASSPINFEPGTAYSYSNTGIDIAAAVVEVVTGMKWEDYLKKEVLDPLGMKNTWFWPTDAKLKNKIELYMLQDGAPAQWMEENPWSQRPYNGSDVHASAGAGLWTTADDQLKFYKMLMNLGVGDNGARILEEETVRRILAVSGLPQNLNEGYSLGFSAPKVDDENGWFGHGGAWGTYCMMNWHKKQLILWVCQYCGGPRPWDAVFQKAYEQFFNAVTQSSVSEYTGRLK